MKLLTTVMYLAICMLLSTTYITAQNTGSPNKFAQFYVVGISNSTESRNIDLTIRGKQGVLMSRTDHNSRILFCIFDANAAIDENAFISWLNGHGFQISCYREGIHGVDKVYSKEDYSCD